jgi:hypothetical protein
MTEKRVQNKGIEKILEARTTDESIAAVWEEGEAADRQDILEGMTPACRKKLKYFETWLREAVNHILRSRYELGLQVRELYEDEKKNGGKVHGKDAIGRICKTLRLTTEVLSG